MVTVHQFVYCLICSIAYLSMVIGFIGRTSMSSCHWFATPANPDDKFAKPGNQPAELLFKYVAESYSKHKPQHLPPMLFLKRLPSPFLQEAPHSFLVPASFQGRQLHQRLNSERLHLRLFMMNYRYLLFEAVPISREAGGWGPGVGEPLLRCFVNPLLMFEGLSLIWYWSFIT